MERATHIDKDGWYINGAHVQTVFHVGTGVTRLRGKDIDRLAAYEETGLEPETVSKIRDVVGIVLDTAVGLDRLRELARADRDGRCVVLPNKAGDTVQLEAFRGGKSLGAKPHKVLGAQGYMMVEGEAGEAWIEIEDFEAEASRCAKKEDTNVRHD